MRLPDQSKQIVYDELFDKLLKDIETQRDPKISQPKFLQACIQNIILNYLEDVFFAADYTERDSERTYSKAEQRNLTILLNSYLEKVRQISWSHFTFDIIEMFNFCMTTTYEKYKVNVNVSNGESLELKTEPAININNSSHKNFAVDAIEIPDLKKLNSFPLYSIFQEGKHYFSRVAPYSVFAKLSDKPKDHLFKAYYMDPEENKIKAETKRKLIVESKPKGLYIKEWQTLPDQQEGDTNGSGMQLKERPLTSYEINDFKLGIKGLKKFQQRALKILTDQILLPRVLINIMITYLVYKIPFKVIGRVYVDNPDYNAVHKYLDRRPGLELFDRMKFGEIYQKYNKIFYYCLNFNVINRWTRKSLQKRIHTDYCYMHPLEKKYDNREPGDFIVEKEDTGWGLYDIQNTLEFFAKSIKTKPKSGQVFQHITEVGGLQCKYILTIR